MRPKLRFSLRAVADIEEIGVRIAAGRNPTRAVSYTRELPARCVGLPDFPEAAPLRPDYGPGVRALRFGRFAILYRWHADRGVVRVSRVVGGAQRVVPV